MSRVNSGVTAEYVTVLQKLACLAVADGVFLQVVSEGWRARQDSNLRPPA